MKVLNYSPANIVIGDGALEYLKNTKGLKVLLVSGGSSMRKSGVLGKIEEYLREGDNEISSFTGIEQDPTIGQIREGVKFMHGSSPDVLVAVGGGSVIDAAKAMILFYEHPELTLDEAEKGEFSKERKIKLIAIPSTSGTASEVTYTSVITDPDNKIKVAIRDRILKPDTAILDTSIAMSMPDKLSAATGMDALAHAIECYTRLDLDDFSEVLAVGAVVGILKWLPISVKEKSMEAREKMHYYQCMAGLAFTNVGVTAVHGISHAIGAMYHMPHGIANGIMLPYVLKLNRTNPVVKDRLDKLSYYCHCDDVIEEIRKLKQEIGIPQTLRDGGIPEEQYIRDIDLITEKALFGSAKFNPIPLDKENMRELLLQMYYGE